MSFKYKIKRCRFAFGFYPTLYLIGATLSYGKRPCHKEFEFQISLLFYSIEFGVRFGRCVSYENK